MSEEQKQSIDQEEDNDLFEVLYKSVEGLEDRFDSYYENPTPESFNEFNGLITEIIGLFRDIKNMAKKMLPASERPKREPKSSAEKIESPKVEQNIAISQIPELAPNKTKTRVKRTKAEATA